MSDTTAERSFQESCTTTVFVVSHTWIHEGSEIKEVFATYEAAKAYVDSQDNNKYDWYDIEEWEVK